MRVTFNTGFSNLMHEVNATAARLLQRQREVASGKRVNVPSDDPGATLGIIAERTEGQRLDRFVKTADTAEARLRVTDSVLTGLVSQLQAALTQAAAGRSTVLTPEARNATALALVGIRDAVLAGVNTQYQGTYLFSGAQSTTAPYVKTGTTVSAYQGDATVVSVDVSRSQSVAVTLDGEAVLRGADPRDVFSILTDVAAAIAGGDMAAIDLAIVDLNRAFARITQVQSRVGTDLAALSDEQLRLAESKRASDVRRSTLEDANLAESISGMNGASQAHEAALAALSRQTRLTLLDYLR
jgi:flagellar hook-associated protein 3 FlgL